MTQKRILLEVGSGNDWRGRDYTKAALRAVQDAIHHCSLSMLKTLDIDPSEMLIEITSASNGQKRSTALQSARRCLMGA